MMTPGFNHLLCFNFVGCAEKVSELINRPVVSLLGTRVFGTSTAMITQSIYLEFPVTTSLIGRRGKRMWKKKIALRNVLGDP